MIDLLVVGYSARALARSALAAGLDVATIDAFGDRDLVEPAPAPAFHRTVSPFDPAQLAAAAPPTRRLAWTSNLENFPAALRALAQSRTMVGNDPAVVERVRRPESVADVLEANGLPAARVVPAELAGATHGWALLRKPRASGGGRGVERWLADVALGDDAYLQEEVPGIAGSLLFLADGCTAAPVAVTRQLVGEAEFGAAGYAWSGNLTGDDVLPRQAEVAESALAAAEALTREFGLRGLNGLDFMARGGLAVVIEVNPRWTGSAELAERARGVPLFPAHARAVAGELAPLPAMAPGVFGKAVIYARSAWTARDTDAWVRDQHVCDVPAAGTTIPAGAPICTVLAHADTPERCLEALRERAAMVYAA